MAETAGDDKSGSKAFSKRYDNTVVSSNAHAHQGDISQDVNISGGVHFHLHPRLDQVAPASVIVELVHVSKQLLEFGNLLLADRRNAPETQKLAHFLKHLSQVHLKLQNHRGLGALGVHAQAEAQVCPLRSSIFLFVTKYHAHLPG